MKAVKKAFNVSVKNEQSNKFAKIKAIKYKTTLHTKIFVKVNNICNKNAMMLRDQTFNKKYY